VNRGTAKKAQCVLERSELSPGSRALLQSATLRAAGELSEALTVLDISAASPKFRKHIARARRSIFHQQRDNLSLALDGVAFFDAEPHYIDFKYLITIAAAAENAEREDLFSNAVARIVRDSHRVAADEKLSARHLRDFVTAKMSLFDFDGATSFLMKPALARKPAAHRLMNEVNAVRSEVDHYTNDVKAARGHILSRATLGTEALANVSVFLSAAAFRNNVVDYPGFRSDIRFIFGEIVSHLRERRIAYGMRSRIKTHGSIRLDHPYFSYHTISDRDYGCHFKETDRPSLFSFDRSGYAGWSHFSRLSAAQIISSCSASDQLVAEFFEDEKQRVIRGNISKYEQPPPNAVERLSLRYIFVALQLLADAVSQNAFMTPFEMLDEIIGSAQDQGLCVVVKRHPLCSSPEIGTYLCNIKKNPNVIVSSGNIHSLIAGSEAVCVINSGVGSEALLHEKPVYVFGRSDYMSACHVCRAPRDFSNVFVPGKALLSQSDLKQFWWMYRKDYAIDVSDRVSSSIRIREVVDLHLARFELT
jgi:hypothetical protein